MLSKLNHIGRSIYHLARLSLFYKLLHPLEVLISGWTAGTSIAR